MFNVRKMIFFFTCESIGYGYGKRKFNNKMISTSMVALASNREINNIKNGDGVGESYISIFHHCKWSGAIEAFYEF